MAIPAAVLERSAIIGIRRGFSRGRFGCRKSPGVPGIGPETGLRAAMGSIRLGPIRSAGVLRRCRIVCSGHRKTARGPFSPSPTRLAATVGRSARESAPPECGIRIAPASRNTRKIGCGRHEAESACSLRSVIGLVWLSKIGGGAPCQEIPYREIRIPDPSYANYTMRVGS